MRILIDGYNLLHALGLIAAGKPSAQAWRIARKQMLDWLADQARLQLTEHHVTVVFDAMLAPIDRSKESSYRGILVQFSPGVTADDWIESRLAYDPHANTWTVVSNDNRVRSSAERAGATGWKIAEFLDWLGMPLNVVQPTVEEPTKSDQSKDVQKPIVALTDAENAELLKVFDLPQPSSIKRMKRR